MLGGHMAGFVHPILKQFAGLGGLSDQRPRMRAEARKQREFLAADQHVDRIDLDEANLIEHLAEMTAIDAARGSRIGETLRGERYSTCLSGPERATQSATVMVTLLMTTSVSGRSPRAVCTACIASRTSRPFTI